MTPEGVVKKKVRAFLDALPKCWYFMPVSNGMGSHGIPDFIGLLDGRFFAIETKASGKRPTKLQEYVGRLIMAAGGMWIVAVGDDAVDSVARVLDGGKG